MPNKPKVMFKTDLSKKTGNCMKMPHFSNTGDIENPSIEHEFLASILIGNLLLATLPF